MILHPSIIALLLSSTVVLLMAAAGTWCALVILLRWDPGSGSDLQLSLERRTYLVSTLIAYSLGFQLVSLFLFLHTADSLSPMFVGAMCAAGTLKVDPHGYAALTLKVANAVLAGLWLVLNRLDNRGYDYPLIRLKYLLLLLIAPLLTAEWWFQWRYFLGLKADVITSCCGALFGGGATNFPAELAALPPIPTQIVFYAVMGMTVAAGLLSFRLPRLSLVYSTLSLLAFPLALVSLISFIAPYIYALPTHHCPFCILQKEYRYVGYFLYAPLLTGTVTGAGVLFPRLFSGRRSLAAAAPALQRRLTAVSVSSFALFTMAVAALEYFSVLTLR